MSARSLVGVAALSCLYLAKWAGPAVAAGSARDRATARTARGARVRAGRRRRRLAVDPARHRRRSALHLGRRAGSVPRRRVRGGGGTEPASSASAARVAGRGEQRRPRRRARDSGERDPARGDLSGRTPLGPVRVGRLGLLGPEGEGDLLLRRARRGRLHASSARCRIRLSYRARRRSVPRDGRPDVTTLHLQYWLFGVGFVWAFVGILADRVPAWILWPFPLLLLVAPRLGRRFTSPRPTSFSTSSSSLAAMLVLLSSSTGRAGGSSSRRSSCRRWC